MTLLSAKEDFQCRTLGALPGLLARLSYLQSLLSAERTYAHWGLARRHGDDKAQAALAALHQEMVEETICRPWQDLWQDALAAGKAAQLRPVAAVGTPRLAAAHFSLVVEILSAVRSAAPRPGASPLPPPGR